MCSRCVISALLLIVICISYVAMPSDAATYIVTAESKKARWAGITLHHTASRNSTLKGVDKYHKSKGWLGIGYHFFIKDDGTIMPTFRWWDMIDGAHAKGHNKTIGIVLVGDFTKRPPTAKQQVSLRQLIKWLHVTYGELKIQRHSDVRATECPGRLFNIKEIMKWTE